MFVRSPSLANPKMDENEERAMELTRSTVPITRCAIYTRKSVLGRFDPDYNSIETQRDICSAYIKSQAHRGWRELPAR